MSCRHLRRPREDSLPALRTRLLQRFGGRQVPTMFLPFHKRGLGIRGLSGGISGHQRASESNIQRHSYLRVLLGFVSGWKYCQACLFCDGVTGDGFCVGFVLHRSKCVCQWCFVLCCLCVLVVSWYFFCALFIPLGSPPLLVHGQSEHSLVHPLLWASKCKRGKRER